MKNMKKSLKGSWEVVVFCKLERVRTLAYVVGSFVGAG